jgi:hypothetical protein
MVAELLLGNLLEPRERSAAIVVESKYYICQNESFTEPSAAVPVTASMLGVTGSRGPRLECRIMGVCLYQAAMCPRGSPSAGSLRCL